MTTSSVSTILSQLQSIYMPRFKHPKKEIEEALKYAEIHGWVVNSSSGHAWGRMYCPMNNEACRCGEFCIVSIWSTPKNSFNHGKQIRRVVDNCISKINVGHWED